MTSAETDIRRAYGWRDFDQEVVEGLVENDLALHQPAEQRLDSPRHSSVTTTPGSPGRTTTTRRAASRSATRPSASAPRRRTCSRSRSTTSIAGRELIAEAIAGSVGPRRGGPTRQRDERGCADVERAPLPAGGRSARSRRERLHGWRRRHASRSSGSGDSGSSETMPRRGRPSRMGPTRASTFPAGVGS